MGVYDICRGRPNILHLQWFGTISPLAANPERRILLTDAGLAVLAREGARGLTHRAVDREAGLPIGTTSNYFPGRADLLGALAERVFVRLEPDPGTLEDLESRPRDSSTFADHMAEIVERTTRNPSLMLALMELKLEAARNEGVARPIAEALARQFDADVSYQEGSGLPGERREVELLYHALNGLILDTITVPIASGMSPEQAARELARRIGS